MSRVGGRAPDVMSRVCGQAPDVMSRVCGQALDVMCSRMNVCFFATHTDKGTAF